MIALMTMLGVGLLAGIILHESGDDDTSDASNNESETGQNESPAINGSELGDLLLGTSGNEVISGAEGDDNIDARGGNDTVEGGEGNDSIDGGSANDNLFGGEGNDVIVGGNGDDFMRGNAGDDILVDGRGEDHLVGGQGNDTIVGSGIFDEGKYEDLLQGRLSASSQEEVISTLEYDIRNDTDDQGDTINAGAGDDAVVFGKDDTVTGGLGDDVFETGVWMNDESDQATITDFTASDDRMIYYYVAGEAAPELDVVTRDNDDGGTDAFLVADGVEVVRLVNAGSDFNVEDHVSLVELAS